MIKVCNIEIYMVVYYCCRHFAGEDLGLLSVKELKQLERQMSVGIERIRSKKVMPFQLFNPWKFNSFR